MSEPNSVMAARLRSLQHQFIQGLPERMKAILSAWQEVQQQGAGQAEFLEMTRRVHSLAGSAGTFKFFRLGEQARDLETLVQRLGSEGGGADLVQEIQQRLALLMECAKLGPEQSGDETTVEHDFGIDGSHQPLVYLLEDDKELAAESAHQLCNFGYSVEIFHRPADLRAAVAVRTPDVLLADIHLPEGVNAGPEVVAELRASAEDQVPVIFMSGHDTWQDRLNAVRAGGQAYLPKPLNFANVTEQLDTVMGKRRDEEYRILIVEDMALLAEHYAAVLGNAGMVVQIAHDPSRLLKLLPVFVPDLILMDLYMPGCSGLEAAQVIRQHTEYTNLPIVYLSTEKGLKQQLDALRVGGDDFLQKPISDAHLLAAVRIRAGRFRELRALMSRDGLTGLLNHINLKLTLERELAQTRRNGTCLSFIMLDIDHFKLVNDQYGHPVGDRVIQSLARLLSHRLRKGDIAARYGGEEFALILPQTDGESARGVLDELRKVFSEVHFSHDGEDFRVSFSAGIASSPPHVELLPLIEAADSALYQAKHEGRNCIMVDPA